MPAAQLIRGLSILVIAAGLAACGSSVTTRDEPPPGTSVAATMGLPGVRSEDAASPPADGASTPQTAAGQPAATAAAPGAEAPPPAQLAARPPPLTRQQLQDLAPDKVTQTLGEPELVRREPPAEVWQYAVENCVVDVFFFDRGAGPRVAHVEGRDRRGRESSADRCLESLQQRPGAPTS